MPAGAQKLKQNKAFGRVCAFSNAVRSPRERKRRRDLLPPERKNLEINRRS